MKKSSILHKLHRDNNGAGIVMVLIVIGFLGILTGVLMFTTYIGYQMRLVDKQGKDNFYTAEQILDEINIGLQAEVEAAMSDAYADIMVNYSLYENTANRSAKLQTMYLGKLESVLQKDVTNNTAYNIDKIRSYVSPEHFGDGDGTREYFQTYGAIIETNAGYDVAGNPIYPMQVESDGITLQDLKITYVNKKGYVSIISTDIKILLPEIELGQSASIPDINKYCIVANNGLIAGSIKPDWNIDITGSLYAGTMTLGSDVSYSFLDSCKFNFKAMEADGATENSLLVTAGDIVLNNTTMTTSDVDVWSKNIVLNSSTATLDGNSYVQNDTKLEGKNCNLTLSGTYTGFGVGSVFSEEEEDQKADSSSAIVINGMDSNLDFSNLESMSIGGHTYVSTAAGSPEDPNSEDVFMGESVAVKSNQLIYLIPPEAVGCLCMPDGTIGDSVFNSNPLRKEQYDEIINNTDKYILLNKGLQIESLGGKNLNYYMDDEDIVGGSVLLDPITVVKQTNSGTLVYLYMKFKNRDVANEYFRNYYGVNSETVDKYTKVFAHAIKMPDNTGNSANFHLAGNMLAYDDTNSPYELIEATPNTVSQASNIAKIREDMYTALKCKMITNKSQLTEEEKDRASVYKNIVDETALDTMVNAILNGSVEDYIKVETADSSKAAILSKGNYTIEDDGTGYNDNVNLVVAKGDVYLKNDFNGTIIAGGNVIISDEHDYDDSKVELTALNLQDFTQIMRSSVKDPADNEYFVMDIFRGGASFSGGTIVGADIGTKNIDLADLIVYERWSKQ